MKYDNVGMLFVSQAEDGSWKIYAKKGQEGLSALTGLTAIEDGQNPLETMEAGLKANGISNITQDTLRNTDITYSSIFHSPLDDSLTIVFAQAVSPEFIDSNAGQFDELDISSFRQNMKGKANKSELELMLHRTLPGLGARLMGESGLLEPEDGFLGKVIRADEFSYWDTFMETLPIAGLGRAEMPTSPRRGVRKQGTARGRELINIPLRKEAGIGKQYSEGKKEEFSHVQSLSLFIPTVGTPYFGIGRYRNDVLVGVTDVEVLPNRLYTHDAGSLSRPYDGDSKSELLNYIHSNTRDRKNFDISDWDLFQAEVRKNGSSQYNEILGRMAWNPNRSKLCVFKDNERSKWLAIYWARKMDNHIQALANKKYQANEITEDELHQFLRYQTPVGYYYPGQYTYGELTKDEIKKLIDTAQLVLQHQVDAALKFEQYGFILPQIQVTSAT